MSDFVNEQVNKLNSTLSTIFKNESVNTLEYSTAHSSTEQAMECKDFTSFLTLASRDIDLSSNTTLPDMKLIQKYLVLFHNQPNIKNNSLEWLFIAKCTVAVYGYMLKNILNSTLPLSEAIQYWNSICGSTRYETFYALQTLPIRISYLGINAVRKMRTTQAGLKNLFSSPELLFINMFPTHARSWIKSSQRKTLQFFTMKHGSMFNRLIHEEIRQKIQTLDYFRTQQASRLGLMMKLTPFMNQHENRQENQQDALNLVSTQVSQYIALMNHMMKALIADSHDREVHKFDVQDTIEYINSSSSRQPAEIAEGLSQIIEDWYKCESNIAKLKKFYGPPSFLTRYWIFGVVGYFAGNAAINIISEKQDDIIEWLQELGITIKDFAMNWIWEPILQVWDTIRLKDERLSVMGKEGLRSDIESLERMVAEFAKDHYKLPENEVKTIINNVREGDMSLVLKAYESEIKHPLKNAFSGDLIQTLLIQVQKTKVDVDLAMAALDKLLKSNELNFAFLAVAPSILVVWGGISWFKRAWQRRSGRNIGLIGLRIRQTMRRVERLFNLTNTNQTVPIIKNNGLTKFSNASDSIQEQQLDCESQGILLCEVHLLRSYAFYLPTRNSIRDLFTQDLRDLEDPKLTVGQKLQTIERMSRSWSFLNPPCVPKY